MGGFLLRQLERFQAFSDAFLLTLRVQFCKFLLVKLLDGELNGQERVQKTPILLSAVLRDDRRARKKASISQWIFPQPASPELPMNPGTAYRRLKTLLEEAGLPSIRFHDLRHTFATHALTSGVNAKTLAGILGHTNASFTLDTYTHVTPDMREAAGGIVGGFMEDLFGKELKPWQRSEKQATD